MKDNKRKRMGQESGRFLNNLDLDVIDKTNEIFQNDGGHHHVEKVIEGAYSLDGSPSFVGELRSDLSRSILMSDEPRILGGKGVHGSPLSYVLYGVLACYANKLAIQAALKGVRLSSLKLSGKLSYDIGPVLTGLKVPLIKRLEIRVESEPVLSAIVPLAVERCPALYLVNHEVEVEVTESSQR